MISCRPGSDLSAVRSGSAVLRQTGRARRQVREDGAAATADVALDMSNDGHIAILQRRGSASRRAGRGGAWIDGGAPVAHRVSAELSLRPDSVQREPVARTCRPRDQYCGPGQLHVRQQVLRPGI
ncbi:unnamed protein product [Macrosiphum euphorbiae]|uniref:Uncharacterized protein n=1 Tax=Macrosiphum euphorbiae TaxID=13131 RepID=A0AAV0VIJ9_9HEMI|nr:unnamed protein product [Macrosiphum euphorbiae]